MKDGTVTAIVTGIGVGGAVICAWLGNRINLGESISDDEARRLIEMASRPRKNLGTTFSGMGNLGAFKIDVPKPPEPPKKTGKIKLEVSFDYVKELEYANAVEQLRKLKLDNNAALGPLLSDFMRAARTIMENPDKYDGTIAISPVRVGASIRTSPSTSAGTSSRGNPEQNQAYYEAYASGLTWDKVAALFGKSSAGTIQSGAQSHAKAQGLPYPPVRT